MKRYRFGRFICHTLLFLLLIQPSRVFGAEKLEVVVSIPPLADFVKKIAGDSAEVKVMVPPGANPHIYEPSPDQLRSLQRANLYVAVGSGIEFEIAWLSKLKEMNQKVVFCDSSEGIDLIETLSTKLSDHEHGRDPHVWLSPKNAVVMVWNIASALKQLRSLDEEIFNANAKQFSEELSKLDLEIASQLKAVQGKSFLVYHPAWAYFARDYGLNEVAIESEGKEPSAKHLIELINKGRSEGVRAVFISPQFSQKSAQMIASELKGQVIIANDLAEDYIQNIKFISSELRRILSDES